MDCNWGPSPSPPTMTAARIPVPVAILAKVSSIWIASSRVGLRMRARTPECGGCFAIRWMMGRTNASVLPVPVCAVATTSRPASAGPMAKAWTGVGSVKPCLTRLLFNGAESENSQKLFIFRFGFEDENRRADYLRQGEGVADQLPVGFIVPH